MSSIDKIIYMRYFWGLGWGLAALDKDFAGFHLFLLIDVGS